MEHNINNKVIEVARVAPHLQLLSIQDVCHRLNIGHWMVYKLIGENKLKSITIGKRRLIPVQALETFINKSTEQNNG